MPSEPLPPHQPANHRAAGLFALACVLIVAGVVAYALYARARTAPGTAAPAAAPTAAETARLEELRRRPHLIFRITALGPSYGRVGIVPLDTPASAPIATPLSCDRVYASADRGLCLQAARGVLTSYRAIAFDSRFAERNSFKLPGAPSRTRVAANAPIGASTVFVSGDSYSAGGFSTRTTLYDLGTDAIIGDLESFTVLRDGQPFKRPDFNFWGVTFTRDGDRFYATLGTGGDILFVEGSAAARRMTVIGSGVECPSLSPDATRVAYKARQVEGGRVLWRVRVMDLASRATATLTETRSVDDQVEWLDSENILYSLPHATAGSGSSDVWVARSDGTGSPRLFLSDAFSPAVVSPQ